jgi:hypothetical protein
VAREPEQGEREVQKKKRKKKKERKKKRHHMSQSKYLPYRPCKMRNLWLSLSKSNDFILLGGDDNFLGTETFFFGSNSSSSR